MTNEQIFTRSLAEQLALEQQATEKSANSPEGRKELSAFSQKRKPVFANISARMIERKENN